MILNSSLVFLFLLSAPSIDGHRSKKIDKILEHVLQLTSMTNIAPGIKLKLKIIFNYKEFQYIWSLCVKSM